MLAEYPERYRVRLDVGTGVCVWIDDPESLAPGLDMRIEAVDEPMDDALFVEPRRQPGPVQRLAASLRAVRRTGSF